MTGAIGAQPFVLESRGETPDGAGGFVEGWTALGTLWGTLAPAGRGRLRGDRATMHYRVRLRAAPPGDPARPRPGQRLRAGTRVFVVETVHETGAAGLWLECLVREEVMR